MLSYAYCVSLFLLLLDVIITGGSSRHFPLLGRLHVCYYIVYINVRRLGVDIAVEADMHFDVLVQV